MEIKPAKESFNYDFIASIILFDQLDNLLSIDINVKLIEVLI